MKDFRSRYMAAGGGHAQAERAKAAAVPPDVPAQIKLPRHQRRANAVINKHITTAMKKANDLGRSISVRTDPRGRLKVIIGKPLKKDTGPQPGEVITKVEGDSLPALPEGLDVSMSAHTHTADCGHLRGHSHHGIMIDEAQSFGETPLVLPNFSEEQIRRAAEYPSTVSEIFEEAARLEKEVVGDGS